MLAFFQAVQQFAVGRKLFRRSEKRLRLAETISLGPKGFIALVQLDDQELLVGGAGSSISLLAQRPFQNGILQAKSFETPVQQKSEPEGLSFQETLRREVPLLESTPVETHTVEETPIETASIEERVSFGEILPVTAPQSAVVSPEQSAAEESRTTSRKPTGSKNPKLKKFARKSKTNKSPVRNTRKTTRPQEVTDAQ